MTTVTPAPAQSDVEDEPGLLPVAALESAVNATIRQVGAPSLREAMWSNYLKTIAGRGDRVPDHMPWQDQATAKVVTVTAARDACVAGLEAIPELAGRNRVKLAKHFSTRSVRLARMILIQAIRNAMVNARISIDGMKCCEQRK